MLSKYAWAGLPARIMMSSLFLISGFGKLAATAATQGYMESFGVPGILVWPAAAFELTAGALLIAGIRLRPLSLLLAGWCLLTAAIFHTNFADQNQMVNFLKNVTMSGAFLAFAVAGIPGWSLLKARDSQ